MTPEHDAVRALREKTGHGFSQCHTALSVCNGDPILAEGWLKYYGCALNVRPREGETRHEAYMKWVMEEAQKWAEEHRDG